MTLLRPLLLILPLAAVAACSREAAAPAPGAAPPATAAAAAPAAASPPGAVVPVDVCGTYPLASVEAALGGIRKARPLVASPEAGPSPFAGGCMWIAEKMKSARVEIGNAASLAAAGQASARAYVESALAAGQANARPLAGLGEVAMVREDGPVIIVLAASGDSLVQVVTGDVGLDATLAIARPAL